MIFNIQRYSTHDGQDPHRRLPERLLAGLPLVPEPGEPRP